MAKRKDKPAIEQGSDSNLFWRQFQQVLLRLPPEQRSDPQAVFGALSERLINSVEHTRKIQRGLNLGWALDDLLQSTPEELDAKIKKKPPGPPAGTLVNGARLQEIRKELGLSQEELAEKCEVNPRTIQRGEAGDVWSESTFDDVAAALTTLAEKQIAAADLKAPNPT